MARPNVVRADTLDLQDHENPHAAEHHVSPQPNGLAPHQASQVQHMFDERNSEEQSLQEAWNIRNGLSDEPADLTQADGAADKSSSEEDGDGGESEGEGDDDLMDRISSSPSIDDGGYTLYSSPPTRVQIWPARSSSMSPRSPTPTHPCEAFNQSASSTPDSSPFLRSPEFFPLRATEADSSPPRHEDDLSSPLRAYSMGRIRRAARKTYEAGTASQHRQMGRYATTGELSSESQYPARLRTSVSMEDTNQDENDMYNDDDDCSNDSSSEQQESPPPDLMHNSTIRRAPFMGSPLRQHFLTQSQLPTNSSNSRSLDGRGEEQRMMESDCDPPSPTGSIGSWESALTTETASDGQGSHSGADDALETDCDDHDDDDEKDAFLDLDNRFIDSGWGGECLQDSEDIDFEFVYALHTFVATVEGQANATKGDTMVLLDDSNSYWWLVRVVKDSSIGYLPAEHIETPTERLARLNKHRNIDLSATQLSDNTDKPRNPLKKAMRRRNAKTVQFAAPTYVEASDYDYSDDDEAEMIDPYATALQIGSSAQKTEIDEPAVEVTEVAPEGRSSASSNRASFDREQAATAAAALAGAGVGEDEPQLSPKLIDKTEAAPLKSRKGTPRNTDSFLKDDTIETRKITLTPGILREDSNSSSIKTPTETTRNTSMESLTKVATPPEEVKKESEKKKKEVKKGGMLSGLFKSKKKDKKSKESISDAGDLEKPSVEISRDSPRQSPAPSGKSSPIEKSANGQSGANSQLQKTLSQRQAPANGTEKPRKSSDGFVAELEGSIVAQEMATGHEDIIDERRQATQEKAGPLSPITNMLKSSGDKEVKPKKAKRSKNRVELDDFDSPADDGNPDPFKDSDDEEEEDDLSESPIEVSPHTFMHGTENIHIPEPGAAGNDHVDKVEEEGPGSLTSSPSLIEHPSSSEDHADDEHVATPKATQTPGATQARTTTPLRGFSTSSTASLHLSPPAAPQSWNDTSLRAWLEDGSEVRDMLVMIHDKSGVIPVSPEHPLMSGLYVAQRKGVQDLMGELDGLLGNYLQRKGMRY